jgi:hypothetical protein
MSLLAPLLVGWPAILTALALATAGLIVKRFWLLLAAAALFLPPAVYLSGYPAVGWSSLLLPACLIASALAVWRRKFLPGWLLAAPVYLASAWLAIVVLSQTRN